MMISFARFVDVLTSGSGFMITILQALFEELRSSAHTKPIVDEILFNLSHTPSSGISGGRSSTSGTSMGTSNDPLASGPTAARSSIPTGSASASSTGFGASYALARKLVAMLAPSLPPPQLTPTARDRMGNASTRVTTRAGGNASSGETDEAGESPSDRFARSMGYGLARGGSNADKTDSNRSKQDGQDAQDGESMFEVFRRRVAILANSLNHSIHSRATRATRATRRYARRRSVVARARIVVRIELRRSRLNTSWTRWWKRGDELTTTHA